MFGWMTKDLKLRVEQVVSKAVRESLASAEDRLTGYSKLEDLQKQITTLEIEKDRREEKYATREREIEHKVGLERKRQEFEIEHARKSTSVQIREENLSADKERFKAEMDFQRKRLEGEVASLRTLVEKMLERLPSAEIYMDASGGRERPKH